MMDRPKETRIILRVPEGLIAVPGIVCSAPEPQSGYVQRDPILMT